MDYTVYHINGSVPSYGEYALSFGVSLFDEDMLHLVGQEAPCDAMSAWNPASYIAPLTPGADATAPSDKGGKAGKSSKHYGGGQATGYKPPPQGRTHALFALCTRSIL